MRSRRPLPADDIAIALCIQSLMDKANSFSSIKSASFAIPFFDKINLYNSLLTFASEVCMVRTDAARKFGLSAKSVKDPFVVSTILLCHTLWY